MVWACRYRSSHDINNKSESWFGNLQLTLFALGEPPLSRPGCWACAPPLAVSCCCHMSFDNPLLLLTLGRCALDCRPRRKFNGSLFDRRRWPLLKEEAAAQMLEVGRVEAPGAPATFLTWNRAHFVSHQRTSTLVNGT